MDKKLDCEIVRDLLPSYVDGLTNKTTNEAVQEHIEGCTACAEALRLMKEPQKTDKYQDAEVDYLKKIRRRTSRVGIICGIVMMVIGMLVIFSRVFLIGEKTCLDDINYSISVDGNTVLVEGTLASSTSGVARVVFDEKAGKVDIKVYTAPRAFFNTNVISKTYTSSSIIRTVCCDGLILWENGVNISRKTAQLYDAKTLYLGDMPSNEVIVSILGISDQLGAYSYELDTTEEPYGWIINLESPISAEQEDTAKDIMAADSYAMLAVIDNLGYITWRYKTDTGNEEYTVNIEDASMFMGKYIKLYAQSPSELERLMQCLIVKWNGAREMLQETGSFKIDIQNNSSTDIYGMVIRYYLDGTLIGTRGEENASGVSIKKGDEYSFKFVPEDFPSGTSAIDLYSFSFDLSVIDDTGKEIEVCKNMTVSAKYAWTFFFSLTGNYDSGFIINKG